jgi:hypothetical protein
MNTLELWPALHKSALLGTARGASEIVPQDAPESLRAALATDREGALLSLLAAVSTQRRAGVVVPQPDAEAAASTCANDSWPIAPFAACARIRELSWGADHAALRKWLALARGHQVLAPHDALPRLLRLGTRTKNLRSEISPAIGARGRWLAAQNPEWKWARGAFAGTDADEAESAFRDGEDAGRAEAFSFLRSIDAPRAVQVLGELWKSEGVGKRQLWVQMLRPELNASDEDFLENALDDRSDAVHKAAAQVLAALPDSAFERRAIERVRKYLSAEFRDGELHLEIHLPPAWDADWKRDGIDEAAQQLIGWQRTYWLAQMLGFVAPSRWEKLWQATPAQILAAALRDEKTLVEGLSLAAVRTLDRRWTEAILATPEAMQAAAGNTPYSDLLRRVDAGVRNSLLARRVRKVTQHAAPGDDTGAAILLDKHPEPWDAELTSAVLDWLDSLARTVVAKGATTKTPQHQIPGAHAFLMAPKFAALMHLQTLLDAPLDWPEDLPPVVQKAASDLREVAQTRREMHREFDF